MLSLSPSMPTLIMPHNKPSSDLLNLFSVKTMNNE